MWLYATQYQARSTQPLLPTWIIYLRWKHTSPLAFRDARSVKVVQDHLAMQWWVDHFLPVPLCPGTIRLGNRHQTLPCSYCASESRAQPLPSGLEVLPCIINLLYTNLLHTQPSEANRWESAISIVQKVERTKGGSALWKSRMKPTPTLKKTILEELEPFGIRHALKAILLCSTGWLMLFL